MADKKKILIADDFQLLREDLTELITINGIWRL